MTVCFICRRSFSIRFFKIAMQNWVNRSEQDSTMVPNFAPAHSRPHGILLGSAFPKPCCTLRCERNMAYNAFDSSTMKEARNDKKLQHSETISHRLEVYGMNQSAFIRKALSDAIIRPVIVASLVNDDLLAALSKLTAEYGRIGNNLNQIARHLNEWQAPYPDLAKELRDAVVDLTTLKFDVMKKVGDTLGNVQTYQL